METRQAVIFIHGIGTQKAGYAAACRQSLEDRLTRYRDSSDPALPVIYQEVLWSPVTDRTEEQLWERVNTGVDLDVQFLRRLMVNFVGDAMAYQSNGRGTAAYREIHAAVRHALEQVKGRCPGSVIEYTFIAHSLGSVIISNYLYDHRDELEATNLFTLGSPLALWLLQGGDIDRADSPVRVSAPEGLWLNVLDDEDFIAYPLKPVNSAYAEAVDRDLVTEIGRLTEGGPLSHMGYWSDGNVVKPVAYKLAVDQRRLADGGHFDRQGYMHFVDGLWNI